MTTRRNLVSFATPFLLLAASLHAATGCSDEFATPGEDGGAGGEGGSAAAGEFPRLKIVRVNNVAVEDLKRGVDGPVALTFVFDQPMDPETFQYALQSDQPEFVVTSYAWEEDNISVVVQLDELPEVLTNEPLEPRHPVTFRLSGRLRSAKGKALVVEPPSTFYRTIHFDYRLLPEDGSAYVYATPASDAERPIALLPTSEECLFENAAQDLRDLGYDASGYFPMQPGVVEGSGERKGVVIFDLPTSDFSRAELFTTTLEIVKWAPESGSTESRDSILEVNPLPDIPDSADWLSGWDGSYSTSEEAGYGTFDVDVSPFIWTPEASTNDVPSRTAFAVGVRGSAVITSTDFVCTSAALHFDYYSW